MGSLLALASLVSLMGRREQCTYRSDPRLGGYVYIPPVEGCSFPIRLLVRQQHRMDQGHPPSITDPFAIARTSKEILLCFFGVYGSVSGIRSKLSSD